MNTLNGFNEEMLPAHDRLGHPLSEEKFYHTAVLVHRAVVKNGELVSGKILMEKENDGAASKRSCEKGERLERHETHAERLCIRAAVKRYGRKYLQKLHYSGGLSIVVMRHARDGVLRNSKPCAHCSSALAKTGIKVYYS